MNISQTFNVPGVGQNKMPKWAKPACQTQLFALSIAACGVLAFVPLTFAGSDSSAIFYALITIPWSASSCCYWFSDERGGNVLARFQLWQFS
jgi:hypothetical protein